MKTKRIKTATVVSGCIFLPMKCAWLSFVVLSATALHAESFEAEPDHVQPHLVIQAPPEGVHTTWMFYKPVKYLKIEEFNIHVLGTESVSDWMMRESHELIYKMVAALKRPEYRAAFSGHQAILITNADPDLTTVGSVPGHRNTGIRGASLFNEVLVCAEAVDTIRPDHKPEFREWNTPVHEFGHAIEHTLRLEGRSDEMFSRNSPNYNPKMKREYFAWAVENWFASTQHGATRKSMPDWQFDYLSTIFSVDNKWVPSCKGERRVQRDHQKEVLAKKTFELTDFETLAGTYRRNPVQNDWHVGRISVQERDDKGKPTVLRWMNRAGKSWRLFPDVDAGSLRTDEENPYYFSNPKYGRMFLLTFEQGKDADSLPRTSGFYFQKQLYVKTSGPD